MIGLYVVVIGGFLGVWTSLRADIREVRSEVTSLHGKLDAINLTLGIHTEAINTLKSEKRLVS
jgi:hypothetical protein